MNAVSFTVRNLSADAHAKLAKIAKANKRSLAKEVVMAIEWYVIVSHTPTPKSQTAGYFELIHPKRKPAPKRAKGKG